jgi:hypothetical protein
MHQGDADWNDVHQLLQHFPFFAFDRFGRWIDRNQSPHYAALNQILSVSIGIGELKLEQPVGGSPGSFISLFIRFVRQFISISVQRFFGWRGIGLGPASGRS